MTADTDILILAPFLINVHVYFSATNCTILSCGENADCLEVNNIFKCVCKDDYEGPDCQLGEYSLK